MFGDLSSAENELVERSTEEMHRVGMVACDIDAWALMALAASAQVAMRHPDSGAEVKDLLAQAVRQVSNLFARRLCPAVVEVIRLGWRETGYNEDGEMIDGRSIHEE